MKNKTQRQIIMTNYEENIQKDKEPSLKSLDIKVFKTFVEPTHIEFAQGLNIVLTITKCAVPRGLWDFFDSIRWAFRTKQHHGTNTVFGTIYGTDFVEVKLTIRDENGKEITLTSRISDEKGEEFISDASEEEISRLQTYLIADEDKKLVFGSTKIVVANDDKQLATQADGMIGIITDETGASRVFGIERA